MRAGWLERYFLGVWYGPADGHWLRPLGWLYARLMRLRSWLYARGVFTAQSISAPVIVVGNLTAGGTGKSPLVLWLVRCLREQGVRPGIISRGYGGSVSRARAQLVDEDSAADDVGDEPVMLARRARVPVAVCPDRPRAARCVLEAGAQVIVSDDGLQHLALGRDAEILVVDGVRRFGNGRCLPAGPLREPNTHVARFDAVVVNGGVDEDALTMTMSARDAVRLSDGECRPLRDFVATGAHAVAAIGNPQRFFATLRQHDIEIDECALPDHAAIRARDLCFDDDKPVLVTEKDAVKCEDASNPEVWYVPVDAEPDAAADAALRGIVERCIELTRS